MQESILAKATATKRIRFAAQGTPSLRQHTSGIGPRGLRLSTKKGHPFHGYVGSRPLTLSPKSRWKGKKSKI